MPMPMPINRVPIFSDSVSIGTDWNIIGNRSNFFIRPITDIINSWLISVSVYQRIVIVSHTTLLTKIMLGNVYVNKSEGKMVNDWVFNVQTGWVRPTVYRRILYLVFLKCVLFQKKKGKEKERQMPSSKTILGHNEGLLVKCSMKKRTANYSTMLKSSRG